MRPQSALSQHLVSQGLLAASTRKSTGRSSAVLSSSQASTAAGPSIALPPFHTLPEGLQRCIRDKVQCQCLLDACSGMEVQRHEVVSHDGRVTQSYRVQMHFPPVQLLGLNDGSSSKSGLRSSRSQPGQEEEGKRGRSDAGSSSRNSNSAKPALGKDLVRQDVLAYLKRLEAAQAEASSSQKLLGATLQRSASSLTRSSVTRSRAEELLSTTFSAVGPKA